jgi:hypothetical protein
MVEMAFCATAYGGPFTVLMLPVMAFVLSGLAVGAAVLVGLVLLIPGIRDLWRRVGYWSILLSVASIVVLISASKLGLRKVDPVSGYNIMPPWVWSICFFAVVFPIVNFPKRHEHDAQ